MNRKTFIKRLALATGGSALMPIPFSLMKSDKNSPENELFFKISLAQWSLHRTYFGDSLEGGFENFFATLQSNPDDLLRGSEDPLYFAKFSKEKFGIDAVEYVNTFYFDKAEDQGYLNEMKRIADGEGVKSVLIMCDAEGALGAAGESERLQAAENHYKWVDMAKFLGCHSIRVNAFSEGSYDEQMERCAAGLRVLAEYAAKEDMKIMVENHGGLSSNARWLADTIAMVDMPNCGTLPDFGNFTISENETYDHYQGTEELMPAAFGVSAKTHSFDEDGNEENLDYMRLMGIVKDAGYTGHVGIEYEGDQLSENDGIRATKELLIRVGRELNS